MADGGPTVVHVSLDRIYESQQEMLVTLSEIKGALALQAQQDRNDHATLKDHETRLRKMEAKVYAIPGAGVLVSLGSLAWAVFAR